MDKRKIKISNELARYLANYINEEIVRQRLPRHVERNNPSRIAAVSEDTIMNAVDAYEGGAR